MPQLVLPVFPEDVTLITGLVSFCKREGVVYYFQGSLAVFQHPEEDLQSFRMFASQLVVNGNCTQAELVRAFGISSISMKRYVKQYREGGPRSFFQEPVRRGAAVLAAAVLEQAQELLNAGATRSEVARRLELKPNTVAKAVRAGRLTEIKKNGSRGGRRGGRVDEKRAEHRGQPGGDGDGVYAGGGADVRIDGDAFGGARTV